MRNFTFTEEIDKNEFTAFAAECPDSVKTHFLGSWEWGEAAALRRWKPWRVAVREDGKTVATALVLEKKLIGGYSYFYIPRGFTMDYSDRELLGFFTDSMRDFAGKHRAIFFKLDPDIRLQTVDLEGNRLEGESNEELSDYLINLGYRRRPLNYAFENEQPRFTFRIDISGTMDEIRARYSKTTLHEIRKSAESSVEVYRGTEKDIDEFIRLTEITEARQGYHSHDTSFYGGFYDIMHSAGMADIYLGRVDIGALRTRAESELAENLKLMSLYSEGKSKKARNMARELTNRIEALERKLKDLERRPQTKVIVSSYITVSYLDKIWTLYGANDMDYSRFYANYAVYDRMIEDANAEGYRIFDGFGTVGRPDADEGARGLYEFKKKWGGELTEFIGEYDYAVNRPMYLAFRLLIPLRRRLIGIKLKKKEKESR